MLLFKGEHDESLLDWRNSTGRNGFYDEFGPGLRIGEIYLIYLRLVEEELEKKQELEKKEKEEEGLELQEEELEEEEEKEKLQLKEEEGLESKEGEEVMTKVEEDDNYEPNSELCTSVQKSSKGSNYHHLSQICKLKLS